MSSNPSRPTGVTANAIINGVVLAFRACCGVLHDLPLAHGLFLLILRLSKGITLFYGCNNKGITLYYVHTNKGIP